MNNIIFSTLKMTFPTLEKRDLEQLYSQSEQVQYPANTCITGPNDRDVSLYICLLGIIKVNYESIDGKELSIIYLKKGEIFGELSAIDGQQRSARCITKTDCIVLKIPNEVVKALLASNPNFNQAIMLVLIKRIRETDDKLYCIGRHSATEVIINELIKLANVSKSSQDNGEIPFIPKHQELALLAIVSREQTTRIINKIKSNGLLYKEEGKLILPSISKLRNFTNKSED